jgi:hypothetical protein
VLLQREHVGEIAVDAISGFLSHGSLLVRDIQARAEGRKCGGELQYAEIVQLLFDPQIIWITQIDPAWGDHPEYPRGSWRIFL